MKRILFVGLCFLLSCSVALIGVNALSFTPSLFTLNGIYINSVFQNYSGPDSSNSLPYRFGQNMPGYNFNAGDRISFDFTVDGNFDSTISDEVYISVLIDSIVEFWNGSFSDFTISDLSFSVGGGVTSYSEVYSTSIGTDGTFVVTWLIDVSSDLEIGYNLIPFGFSFDFRASSSGTLYGITLSSFSLSLEPPSSPSFEDSVIGSLGDINNTLNNIYVEVDPENIAAAIEEKLRQSDVGTVPESPIDQGEIDELESVEDNLFNLADEKKQSFSDALNTWQGAFTSGGGGGKIGVVTGSIFNKILSIPFIRDLVYLSLGFGLITFTLRLGRKLV